MQTKQKPLLTKIEEIKRDYKTIKTAILILYLFSFLLFIKLIIVKAILFAIISIATFFIYLSFRLAEEYELMMETERMI